MLKFLSRLLLIAAFCMPWVTQAQTTCQIKIVGEDGYGDGWNDGSLAVMQGTTTVATFDASNADDGGMMVGAYDSVFVTVTSGIPVTFVWTPGDYDEEVTIWIYDGAGQMVFTVTEPSSGTIFTLNDPCSGCLLPQGLAADVDGSDVDITWTVGSGTNWQIVWGTGSFNPDTVTVNIDYTTTASYSFTNLDDGPYSVYVRSDCGTDSSAWAGPVSFVIGGCILTIVGQDSYGDGWNGGSLNIVQGGSTVSTFTFSTGATATTSVAVAGSMPVSFVWNTGSYDSEVSFTVYNAGNVVLYSASSPSAGTLFTLNSPCSNCFAPSGMQVDSLSSDFARVVWGGTATSYGIIWGESADVLNNSGTETTTTNTYFEMSNLTSGTGYTVLAWTICDDNETSDTVMFVFATTGDAISEYPYSTGFEVGQDISWSFVNDGTNQWFIGSAAHNTGANGLYISNDNGTTNSYSTSGTQFSYAYRAFTVTDAGQYAFSFDWKAYGEDSYDYLRAWIAPSSFQFSAGQLPDGGTSSSNYTTTTPAGWIDLGGKMNLQNSWQTTVAMPNLSAGSYYLVFMWANDGSVGTQPPAAIDNIVITALTCPSPVNLVSAYSSTDSVILTWQPGGNETQWEVSYDSTSVVVTDTFYVADQLSANTPYTFSVRAICGDSDTSFAVSCNVRTECGFITSLPFTEGFEGLPAGVSSTLDPDVPCWACLDNASQYHFGYPSNTSSWSDGPHSGSSFLYYYMSTTTGTYADWIITILPPVDVTTYPLSTLQLSFWVKMNSSTTSGDILVGVISNVNDESTFIPLDTVHVAGDVYDLKTAYLARFADYADTVNATHVAMKYFRNPSTTTYYFVDDISLENIPDCPPVSNITMTGADTNSIDVTWTENGEATSWTIEYDVTGFTPGTGTTVTVSSLPYTITGLSAGVTYDVYVAPECTSGTTVTRMGTFTTLAAAPATVPYTCNFEETGVNGWDLFGNGQTNYWMVGTATNNGGTQSLYVTNNGTANSYTTSSTSFAYATRTFSLTDAGEYAYTFDWKCDGESNYDYIRAWMAPASAQFTAGQTPDGGTSAYNYTNTTPAGWISLDGGSKLNQQTSWQTRTGTFAISQPGIYTMVFMWANDGSSGTQPPAAIDNVSLMHNDCPAVENLAASYITVDTAIITWTSGSENTSFVIEYDSVPFTAGSGAHIDYVTGSTYTIAGLSAGVTYHVIVRALCNSDTALAIGMSFTTLAALPATVPYSCDFEATGVNGWDLIQTAQNNYWVVGTATNNGGSQSLYVTDNGTANTYSGNDSYSFAVRTFSLQAGNYVCSYDWKCNGESSFDFIRAALVPANTNIEAGDYCGFDNTSAMPAGGIALDGGYRLNLSSNWQSEVTEFTLTTAGTYKMVFLWRNDGSVYNQPPAAIDNVQLMLNTCPMPTNITLSNLTQTGTDVSWEEEGNATSWEYQLGSNTPVVVTDTFCTLTGLTANTPYTFRVRSICGVGDTGMWATYNFRTPCGYVNLPYSEDFENETTSNSNTGSAFVNCWNRLNNGSSYGGFPYVSSSSTYNHTIGGSKGLYWYNSTTTGTYGDYQCVVLPPVDPSVGVDSLQISFWAKASSSSYTPVFKIGVMTDPNNIASFVGIDTVTINTTDWTLVEVPLTTYTGTGQYVAVKADRPSSYWYAYVDDFVLEYVPTCLMPQNVHSTAASTTSITVDWTDFGTPMSWEVRYGTSANNTTTVTTTSHPFTVTGLDTLTSYNFEVRAICSVGDTSRWSTVAALSTEICDNSVAATTGPATSTANYAPINNYWNYSFTETIIDSAELVGIGEISAVAYSYAFSSASTVKTDVTIWLQPTNKTEFTSELDAVDLDTNIAVQVYVGSLNCTQGWNYFQFDAPYTWDGHSNLLVIVNDESGDYDGSNYAFNISGCTGYKTLYYYSDDYWVDPLDPTSFDDNMDYGQFRPTMKLISCGGGCSTPAALPATAVTYQAATLNWSSSATDFEVAVKAVADATWPEAVAVSNANNYTVTGLQPATNYMFRVRALCDVAEDLISDWGVGTFTTDSLPCFAPSNVEVDAQGLQAEVGWTSNGDETQWVVRVYNTTFDQEYTATTNPYTVTGLTANVTYNVTVSSLCGNGVVQSEWTEPVSFTTVPCDPVTNVQVTGITTTTANVSWTAGDNNTGTWKVDWNYHGASVGSSGSVTVNTTSAQLTGLTAGAEYDVSVSAICAAGYESNYTTQTFTTTVGIASVEDGMNLSIYPNPATGNTTITLSGVNGNVTLSVIDMSGRTVKTTTMECSGDCQQVIDVDNLAAGAYFVRVYGDNVNTVKKLIVK